MAGSSSVQGRAGPVGLQAEQVERAGSLLVILAPPVAGSRLVVVRGEPGTGTSRAAWEAVAGVLTGWPLEFPRIAAILDVASCIKRHAVASA